MVVSEFAKGTNILTEDSNVGKSFEDASNDLSDTSDWRKSKDRSLLFDKFKRRRFGSNSGPSIIRKALLLKSKEDSLVNEMIVMSNTVNAVNVIVKCRRWSLNMAARRKSNSFDGLLDRLLS